MNWIQRKDGKGKFLRIEKFDYISEREEREKRI